MSEQLNKFCYSFIELLEIFEQKNIDVPISKIRLAINNDAEKFFNDIHMKILNIGYKNLALIKSQNYEKIFENLEKEKIEIFGDLKNLHKRSSDKEKKIIWSKVENIIYQTADLIQLGKNRN